MEKEMNECRSIILFASSSPILIETVYTNNQNPQFSPKKLNRHLFEIFVTLNALNIKRTSRLKM